jgi:hypothetical protein
MVLPRHYKLRWAAFTLLFWAIWDAATRKYMDPTLFLAYRELLVAGGLAALLEGLVLNAYADAHANART